MKINLTLTRQSNDPRGRRVVQAIIEMARTLGLVVVAEGVEDLETREALVLLGVQKLQGYLYSRPISAPEFDSFLKTTNDWLTKNVA